MSTKHIATYPIYGSNPITGRVWNKRVGTGYINRPEQVREIAAKCAERGHPFNIRFRNDACRDSYIDWLASQESQP